MQAVEALRKKREGHRPVFDRWREKREEVGVLGCVVEHRGEGGGLGSMLES